MFPRIVVNAKVYAEATGRERALALARACQEAARAAGEPIGVAPPQVELSALGAHFLAPAQLFAQHVDGMDAGIGTGAVTAAAIAAAGAVGAILNHAERKMAQEDLAAAVARLHERGLHTLVCADSLEEARRVARLRPTAVAIEPPELIGGDVSVTSADPRIVGRAVQVVRQGSPETLVLCGAGVKTGGDVRAALRLGAHGVLLASGVVKAKDPQAALAGLVAGLR